MVMCKSDPDEGYESLEEEIDKHFHTPGEAKEYLERVSVRWYWTNLRIQTP